MSSMTSQRKSHVFRVTGLSRELPDENLKTALQEAINNNLTDDERSHIQAEITIVPSCYESDTQRVALVHFRGGVPQFLHELRNDPLDDWQVEMGDDDINFDGHFFGFTQLYVSDDDQPVAADIIAIAGLDGHAYGSWQGTGNLGRMWLRDFLSKDLPQCRTMIYGYNSKLSSHGVDTILDYGRELMEEIKKIRNTKEVGDAFDLSTDGKFGLTLRLAPAETSDIHRTQLWGHYLGSCGTPNRAIQTMEEDHPAITSLHRATYGMMLFAIPHKGLVMDDIQQMLAGDGRHPRGQLLQQISSKSDLLIHQLADFKNLIRDRKVVSFYETEQTRRLVLDSESGRWKRTGEFMTTVGVDSALLQLPDHIDNKVPLHADHSMLVKFDTPYVAGYRTVRDRLLQFSKDAPPVVAARFAQIHPTAQPLSTVPSKRDRMFLHREETRVNYEAISQRHERLKLVGLADVRNNQTAIKPTNISSPIIYLAVSVHPYGRLDMSLKTLRIVPDNAEIMQFSKKGSLADVQSLFTKGLADPTDVNYSWGVPVLSYAVQGLHLDLCRFLIREGALPNVENRSNVSALDRAWDIFLSQSCDSETEQKLRSIFSLWFDSVWFEDQQFTSLHKIVLGAVDYDLEDQLKLSTSSINEKDSKGCTALAWAAARGDISSVKTLLSFGANPEISCDTGNNPLLRSVRAKSPECVRLLLEFGADVRQKSTLGFTALHYSAYYRDDEALIQTLLGFRAQIDEKDNYGWTPLSCTAEYDQHKSARVLLNYGADPNIADNIGWTSMLRAVSSNSHNVLKLLMEKGAEYCSLSSRLETILHIAAARGDIKTIELLTVAKMRGLNADLKDIGGRTAADIFFSRDQRAPDLVAAFTNLLNSVRIF
ncbi:hypothetical protein N7520_010294 [Penicillium odoratum]|uniref:uncharacterized protein n=1 Tax=Penicillium odoratum TaxID=1167516 RepID=UPI00254857B6|nr:uncharacterized protein N7520_010294 [Penicillium odoratum]KAJ5745112.1 hypothetical protein N7520_010294 [Penicillium odoratum]